ITGFLMVYVPLAYASSRMLLSVVLANRLLSGQLALYFLYFSITLIGVGVSLPDSLFRHDQFLSLANPVLLQPADFFYLPLLPLPAVLIEYRKRKIQLASRDELLRLICLLAGWVLLSNFLKQLA